MTEVSDFMKKTLAFGLGVAALTGDKVKQLVDEAVQRGEMSKDEARKLMNDVTSRADEERDSIQSWIKDQVNKVLAAGGAASVERVRQLEARVAGLEERLAALIPSDPEGVEPRIMSDETPPSV